MTPKKFLKIETFSQQLANYGFIHSSLDMIKVSWSKKFITAIYKFNKRSFDDDRVDLPDRMSTFEGDQHLVEIKSVASSIARKNIELACENISNHVINVSGGNIQITWMTLYFKFDSKGKLWLLFCSRIKVRDYVRPIFGFF